MKLKNLLNSLALSELSQHKMGKTGVILLEDYPKVINHIQAGLTTLYERFPLSTKEVVLLQNDIQTSYRIHSDNSFSKATADGTDVSLATVMDTVAVPFTDDILRLEGVWNGEGKVVPLNDEYRDDSWFTTSAITLDIAYPVAGNVASVIYRANHAVIPLTTTVVEADTLEIELPGTLHIALAAYVASRIYISLGNASSAQLSSMYNGIYTAEVEKIERLNLLRGSSTDTNIKFVMGGWI